jgi:hypothetical protein
MAADEDDRQLAANTLMPVGVLPFVCSSSMTSIPASSQEP